MPREPLSKYGYDSHLPSSNEIYQTMTTEYAISAVYRHFQAASPHLLGHRADFARHAGIIRRARYRFVSPVSVKTWAAFFTSPR